MNGHLLATLALTEVKLRLRRRSTLAAVLLTAIVAWAVIVDPASGHAVMVIGGQRVLYTSSALAISSALLAGMFFGLGGFYLVRGRIGEDLRAGTGGVIGASPVANASFLWGRWCGAVAYLSLLVVSFLAAILVLHLVRGEGPLEPLVYLGTYAVLLLPMVVFAASCAILFDSVAALMGKGGDVLYFFVWVLQVSLVGVLGKGGGSLPLLCDFTGILVAANTLQQLLHTNGFAIGASPFDATRAALLLPALPWTASAVLLRAGATLLALLPLLPAALLFHRFSPDRVKARAARQRRSPLDLANALARPMARLVQPLFGLAARVPGLAGQVLAELGLLAAAAPFSLLALALVLAASVALPVSSLGPLVAAAVALWGILIAGLATRDYEADTEALSASVAGGEGARFWRQLLATWSSGLLFTGVALLRWAPAAPLRALALAVGVFTLAALATALGRAARTARAFLGPFLFFVYVMLNAAALDWLDLVGANGSVTLRAISLHAALGAAALGLAWAASRRAR
ncbi:hypothetical protein [Massilia sp. TS11]|uniref:hypothetical protein n=1 Tax=Massilia sp. TS11 TaxID=2908003 RepID=UPI001EDA6CD8|nr:hypothetical protein [Massilia sp. TS11]MCG2583707.1 hypothetical protein [Massilia sp. TS11]